MANKKLRFTALGSINLSDSLVELTANFCLPEDANTAMQFFPTFRFDSEQDEILYGTHFWKMDVEVEKKINTGQRLMGMFDAWYKRANQFERLLVGISALTNSFNQIDNVVWESYLGMRTQFRLQYQDVDGSFFLVDDYEKMRLEENLNTAISTPRNIWWCRLMEQQVHRIKQMPKMPFGIIQKWNRVRHQEYLNLINRSRRRINAYVGTTPKQTRRILNRSIDFFTRMFGDNAARQFVSGKNLWIRGEHFVWKLKLEPQDLISFTVAPSNHHPPFTIHICDHELNRLANACVVFQDTPVLDQAVSFALSIAHPEDELNLLRKTNLSGFTDLGRAHELLNSMPSAQQYLPPITTTSILAELANFNCPTIDDDVPDDEDQVSTLYYNRRYDFPSTPIFDEFSECFRSEDRVSPPQFYSSTGFYNSIGYNGVLSDEQTTWLTNEWEQLRHELAIERRDQNIHPIATLLRQKLMTKLDVDPDIFEYMRFPEFRFTYLNHIRHAPRMEAYVGAKIPLCGRLF